MTELTNNLVNFISNGEFSILFLLVSFLGGILASISPCSLGIIPLIVGYVGGYGDSNKKKTTIQLSSFVLGLSFVLTIIGIICAFGGKVFVSIGGSYWILFLASLILIMGLNLLNIVELNFTPIVKRIPKGNSTSLFIYPFLIGVLFAFASSPCSTPILAGIMGFATLTKNLLLAGLMLLCFSLGQGVIIVLSGIFTSFLKGIKNFSNISEILMKISGILLIIASFLIYLKVFSKFFN
ncbi:MAG: cytochrome c biogenesis protein CcdA [Candidatus Gastranaerophilales bacterium]|nr:cytochrome c biogenesis protein CcdA [Candidatus Gastranaerophilales bacterium]